MSASRSAALSVVGLALVAGNVYAYRQWTAERANSAYLGKQLKDQTLALADAQAARRTAESAAQAAAFEARAAQARVAAAAATSAGPAIASTPAVKPKESASPPPDGASMQASIAARMADYRARLSTPEGREAYKRQQVASMRRGMSGLGDALGLDEQGVDRFFDVIAEYDLRRIERMGSNTLVSSPATAPNARADMTADIAAAFGSDVASRYQAYQEGSQGRGMVRNLLVGFAEADVSLNKAQRQQLADSYTAVYKAQRAQPAGGGLATIAFVNSSDTQPQDMLAIMQHGLDTTQSTDNAVLAEAASYLNPSQLKVLQKQQQSSLESQRLGLDMMRQRSAATGSGAASGFGGGNIVVRP
jgi:hypothetical protein